MGSLVFGIWLVILIILLVLLGAYAVRRFRGAWLASSVAGRSLMVICTASLALLSFLWPILDATNTVIGFAGKEYGLSIWDLKIIAANPGPYEDFLGDSQSGAIAFRSRKRLAVAASPPAEPTFDGMPCPLFFMARDHLPEIIADEASNARWQCAEHEAGSRFRRYGLLYDPNEEIYVLVYYSSFG